MKKFIMMIPVIAMLAACGTTDPYGKRADAERERQERYVEKAIDRAPKWMTQVPVSNSAVYESGTAVSSDFSMADYKAKADAYGKICMTAGGTVDQGSKIYRADTDAASSEMSELVIRSSCKGVDLTGVEVADRKIIAEGPRYRAYVLVVLPTGDANILRKAKDQQKLAEQTARRAPEAFKELDQ